MDWQTLPSRARWLFHLQALMRLALFWTPVCVFGAAMATPWTGWMGAVGGAVATWLLAAVWSVWAPSLAWSRWAWVVRDHDLLVHRGVLLRLTTAIPLSRIQHVDTRQGPLEQLFGLQRVTLHTASGGGADAAIPGLDPAQAEALRDRLVRVEGDDGV